MKINIYQMLEGAKSARGMTVIIDVFRAMTVETYLMKNNAAKIIPVGDVEEAFAYRDAHPDAILCGERDGIMIEGFDFGNSPSQVENVDFSGKTVVHTTSAGTQGFANAVGADEIIAGSLVSASAIAEYIRRKNPDEVSLVAMGLAAKRPTDEDTLAAEYIKSILEGAPLSDLDARIARLAETDGAKFFNPKMSHVFPTRDFELSTAVDTCPFILRLMRGVENGLDRMERIDVL